MAKIFCFSSTGNSLYAAKRIAEQIGGEVISMTSEVTECSDEVIGFIFPTYFWGVPRTVERFVSDLKITAQAPYVFAITTYGGYSMGVVNIFEKLFRRNNEHLKLAYAGKIKMTENYLPCYQVNESAKLDAEIESKLDTIIVDLQQCCSKRLFPKTFINNLAYMMFPALNPACDTHFTVGEKCNGCGVCSKICPMNNVKLIDSKPQFQHHCEHCLACVHACPTKSIDWRGMIRDKKRFRNAHIGLSELQDFIGKEK